MEYGAGTVRLQLPSFNLTIPSRGVSRLRLAQVRNHLMMVRGYSSDRVVAAEGERVKGLGLVEVYIKGKPFIIYRMKRNRDFIRGNFGC